MWNCLACQEPGELPLCYKVVTAQPSPCNTQRADGTCWALQPRLSEHPPAPARWEAGEAEPRAATRGCPRPVCSYRGRSSLLAKQRGQLKIFLNLFSDFFKLLLFPATSVLSALPLLNSLLSLYWLSREVSNLHSRDAKVKKKTALDVQLVLLSCVVACSLPQCYSYQLVPNGFKSKPVSRGSDTICIPRTSVQILFSPPGAQQMLAFVCSLLAFPGECEMLLNLIVTSLFVTASAGFGCVTEQWN